MMNIERVRCLICFQNYVTDLKIEYKALWYTTSKLQVISLVGTPGMKSELHIAKDGGPWRNSSTTLCATGPEEDSIAKYFLTFAAVS